MKQILLTVAALLLTAMPLMAQDLIIPKKGNPITAYNVEAGGGSIYYTAEQDANSALSRIAKDSVLMIRRADGSVMDFTATQPTASAPATPVAVEKPKVDYPVIDEADIHGCLIAQGNKVFIPTNSHNECERVAQEQLKKHVSGWDYWTVVDEPEQAHFILQYVLTSRGQDYAWLFVRPRKYYDSNPFVGSYANVGVLLCVRKTDDSDPQINLTNADIFFNHIKGMLSDPDYEKKVSRRYKQASETIKGKNAQKFLNADHKSNDYGYTGGFSDLFTLD